MGRGLGNLRFRTSKRSPGRLALVQAPGRAGGSRARLPGRLPRLGPEASECRQLLVSEAAPELGGNTVTGWCPRRCRYIASVQKHFYHQNQRESKCFHKKHEEDLKEYFHRPLGASALGWEQVSGFWCPTGSGTTVRKALPRWVDWSVGPSHTCRSSSLTVAWKDSLLPQMNLYHGFPSPVSFFPAQVTLHCSLPQIPDG